MGKLDRHELALKLLTAKDEAPLPPGVPLSLTPLVAKALRNRHRAWLQSKSVRGFAIGLKVTNRKKTGVLAIKVLVNRKRSGRAFTSVVPKRISIPGLGVFCTDVLGVGAFRVELNEFREFVRPIAPGCSISPQFGATGTLGCLVRRPGLPTPYGLTCAHVVTNDFRQDPQSAPFDQPSTSFQTGPGNFRVGVSGGSIPVAFDPEGFPNQIDAGLIELDPTIPFSPVLRILNLHPKATFLAPKDKSIAVQKVGTMTNLTQGEVTFPRALIFIFYRDSVTGVLNRRAGFFDVVLASYWSEPGDSGSLVVDSIGRAVGIHIGRFQSHAAFCLIDPILAAFGVTLWK